MVIVERPDSVPRYTVTDEADLSFEDGSRTVNRVQYSVEVNNSEIDLSDTKIQAIGQDVIARQLSEDDANGIQVEIHIDGTGVEGIPQKIVQWGPEGDASKAKETEVGDYSRHEISVD